MTTDEQRAQDLALLEQLNPDLQDLAYEAKVAIGAGRAKGTRADVVSILLENVYEKLRTLAEAHAYREARKKAAEEAQREGLRIAVDNAMREGFEKAQRGEYEPEF